MRTLALSTLLFAALAASLPRDAGAASIVRSGDPTFSFLGPEVFSPGHTHFGLDFERYAKDLATSDPLVRSQESEVRFALSAARTFGQYVTLVAKIPFARRTLTTGDDSAWLLGLSDPEIRAHYQFYTNGSGSWAAASLGFRPGLGQNDRTIEGELAEEQLQPGRGATGLEGGVSYLRPVSFGENAFAYGSAIGRKSGRNARGYSDRSTILLNLGLEKPLSEKVNGVIEANYRYASSDEVSVGVEDPNTGGSVVYLSPRVRMTLTERMSLRVGVQLPILKSLKGDQNEKLNLLSGLTIKF
jgi:hypothetical protein